jgi:hypothetical protein
MAIDYDVYKPKNSLTLTRSSVKMKQVALVEADSEIDAILSSNIPSRYESKSTPWGTVYVSDITAEQMAAPAGAGGDELYQVTVQWETVSRSNPVVNTAVCSMDTETERILIESVENAEDQVHYGPEGSGSDAYTGTAINVTDDGVEGVEIEVHRPVLTIEDFRSPTGIDSYIEACNDLAGSVNNSAFTGIWGTWQAGEARYTGPSTRHRTGDMVHVRHRIVYSPNKTINVYLDTLGDEVTITKPGWHYLWKRVQRWTDPEDESRTYDAVLDAHVARVYDTGDFDILDLPASISWEA